MISMKVGIITFHYGDNFGGVLQALATQLIFQSYGLDAEMVNYVPSEHGVPLRPWQGWGLSKGLSRKVFEARCIRLRYEQRISRKFELYRSAHMKRSVLIHDLSEFQRVCRDYDILVSGSDQIWHLERSTIYFLDTSKGFAGNKISYGSCCGHSAQSGNEAQDKRNLLEDYSMISVRNKFSADVIQGLTGREPAVVADPTMLLDLKDLESEFKLPFDEYILLYCLGKEIDGSHRRMIQEIRRRIGDIPVVAVVASSHKPQRIAAANQTYYAIDPGEWLTLIRGASFIYTDSFHALLFAIRYDVPALAYYKEAQRAERLLDFAARYRVEAYVTDSVDRAVKSEGWELPYALEVKENIAKHVSESKQFLKDALSSLGVAL